MFVGWAGRDSTRASIREGPFMHDSIPGSESTKAGSPWQRYNLRENSASCLPALAASAATKGQAPPHPSERFKTRNQNIEGFEPRCLAIQARQATPAEDRKPQVGHEEQTMSLIQQYEVG